MSVALEEEHMSLERGAGFEHCPVHLQKSRPVAIQRTCVYKLMLQLFVVKQMDVSTDVMRAARWNINEEWQ